MCVCVLFVVIYLLKERRKKRNEYITCLVLFTK